MEKQNKMEGYFEDWIPGERYKFRDRFVTETDIDLFTSMTGIQTSVFLDTQYAQRAGYNTRITPALLSMSLAFGGLYQSGAMDNLVGLLSMDRIIFINPVYPGDAIHSAVEVIEKRETKKDDRGLVILKMFIEKASGETISEGQLTLLFRRRQQ